MIVSVKRDREDRTSTTTLHEHEFKRGDRSATKQVGLFNSLLQDNTHGSVLAQRFQIENGFPVMDLQLSVYAF